MNAKYLFFLVMFFNTQTSSYFTPQKCGDLVSLAICTTPYLAAFWTYEQRKIAQANGIEDPVIEKKYPYKVIGFGTYGSEMISYLIIMFLTQKYLWQHGMRAITANINSTSLNAYGLYALLGAAVGLVSATTGIICTKKVVSPLIKNMILKKS